MKINVLTEDMMDDIAARLEASPRKHDAAWLFNMTRQKMHFS
jgi:hypothetical protein